jgi:probable O-glycosylation ligase (exosortase A-associated)
MAGFLWLKSKRKLLTGSALLMAAIGLVVFMPQQWEERIATIADPSSESSANSRLVTWAMLGKLALDRPLVGGGFEPYDRWVYEKYSPGFPSTERIYSAHSIYFQVLGEHGFIALLLFLCFWATVWGMCSQVAAMGRRSPEHEWAYWLAQMLKVSIVAYLVGGAFLNLAYWDVPYYLFVAIAVARWHLRERTQVSKALGAASDNHRSSSAVAFADIQNPRR